MGRPAGSHNVDYDARRDTLAAAFGRTMLQGGAPPTLRGLAAAAGVSVPTVRHYFGDLNGAVEAGFQAWLGSGAPWLAVASDPGDMTPRAGLALFFSLLAHGWEHAVGRMHAIGLSLGLAEDARGPMYLNNLFEPTLQALEARLAHHQARGELRAGDTRVMAIALLAPVFIAMMHQRELGGRSCRPLDEDAFLTAHLDAFLRAWGPVGADSPRQAPA